MFLQVNHYPHFWSPDELAECLVVRVMDDHGDTLGYVWGEWKDTGLMAIHGCAAEGRKLPLFTSNMFVRLCDLAFAVGADEITTNVSLSPSKAALRRLHRRLGLEVAEDEDTLNLWSLHGQKEQEQ